ncbi:glycoside hydrolase family 2 TIM barrel-domain containing protein [Bythopirellula polymerisocia]|uniref:Beta-galactosidase n=1 Tax=Bythopirellula polymerisocia TaxID=2528003 RepID=A0A5C6CRM6_9BACT|nr:glycoside hydrolase family 2 TIM barrel-domain containing protein [Bythopirellula polymerisocia]TWU27573.1 Beta-galactosidase [Bythopirellula polymerisocia]
MFTRLPQSFSRYLTVVLLLVGLVSQHSLVAEQTGADDISNPTRQTTLLNSDWRFELDGTIEGQDPNLDDSQWLPLRLPHTWNTEDSFDEDPGYRRNASWYRRNLVTPENLGDEHLYLRFEGVNQRAEVYVNGQLATHHVGGYTAFVCDITSLLNPTPGASNLIAVRVDNSWDPDVPPIAKINFTIYGGIYRNVHLLRVDPVHIAVNDFASPGVFIDTLLVTRKEACVRIRGLVENQDASSHDCTVINTILSPEGREVGSARTELTIPETGRSEFETTVGLQETPQLWSPDNAVLYRVKTEVLVEGIVRDLVTNDFGIRWFHFDPEQGFILNGEHLYLKGTNRHQDREGFGNALTDEQHREDLELIKQMGANFLRLGHYPQAPAVLDSADKLGLLLWEEIPVLTRISESDAFRQNSLHMLEEMIKQHFNHPSIIVWGSMNEIFLRNGDGTRSEPSEAYSAKVSKLAHDLDARIRQLDPGRVSTMAFHDSRQYDKLSMLDIPQLVAFNRYFGWYGGGLSSFGRELDRQHQAGPERPLFISEYGAGSDRRLNSIDPQRMDFTNSYQQAFAEGHLRQIKERPYLSGAAWWNQFDFGNPYNQDTIPGINQKGLMYFDRTPKDTYYLFQANFSDEPVLHIASRDWPIRIAYPSPKSNDSAEPPFEHAIKVYSNADSVELVVNGTSVGSRQPDDVCAATWKVPLQEGVNQIAAQAKFDEKIVSDEMEIESRGMPTNLAKEGDPFDALYVNVGSHVEFRDHKDHIWIPDQSYQSGGWGHVAGKPRELSAEGSRKSVDVFNTDEDPLYQSFLVGINQYRFDLPDGRYRVTLKMNDYENSDPATRVFDIKVNNEPVVENLDLAMQADKQTALVTEHVVEVSEGKGLIVDFVPVAGEPVLSGISVVRETPTIKSAGVTRSETDR